MLRQFTAIELKKIKREFLALSKMHPPKKKEDFGELFVKYLNTLMEREDA